MAGKMETQRAGGHSEAGDDDGGDEPIDPRRYIDMARWLGS